MQNYGVSGWGRTQIEFKSPIAGKCNITSGDRPAKNKAAYGKRSGNAEEGTHKRLSVPQAWARLPQFTVITFTMLSASSKTPAAGGPSAEPIVE